MLDTGSKRKCRVKEDPRLLLNRCECAQVDQSRRELTPKVTGWLLSNWFTEDLYFYLYTFVWDYARNMCYFGNLKAT